MKIKSLLIANRGEIAIRICRTAKKMGIKTYGIKTSKEVKVGDTITTVENPCESGIEGFEEVKPMVFAGIRVFVPLKNWRYLLPICRRAYIFFR